MDEFLGMPLPTEAELRDVTRQCRDRMLAHLLLTSIQVCAETHPELLREAIGKVFDLTSVEDQGKRLTSVLSAIQAKAADLNITLKGLQESVEVIESRIDGSNYRMDELEDELKT